MNYEKLRQARIAKDWTQEALALKAGVSKRTIVNVERGKPCNWGTAKLIARALSVKFDDLKDNGHA